MTQTTMVHVRIAAETKEKAAGALAPMGMSVSDAVRILLHRIARDGAFPLELGAPNSETRSAMAEARALSSQSTGSRVPLPSGFRPSPSPDEVKQIQSESMSDFLNRLRTTIGDTDIDLEAVIQEHHKPHRGIDL